jgi:pyruvate dehydrogenase E2 component (dihydrolipoyllysine-residue acetyltransferase)
MISEVVMPQMGADMTEGTLIKWMKNEGDQVERGEVIAEIETDKANVEIEAFDSGVFRVALAHEGDTVNVGEVIAVIAAPNDDISKYAANGSEPAAQSPSAVSPDAPQASPPASAGAAPRQGAQPRPAAESPEEPQPESPAGAPRGEHPPTPAPPAEIPPPQPDAPRDVPQAPVPQAPSPATVAQPPAAADVAQPPPAVDRGTPADGRVRASPLAKRIATERNIDLRQVRGSGPGGRIVRKDVEAASATVADAGAQGRPPRPDAAPTPQTITVAPSKMRQAIARRMSQSKREAPHYYLLVDIDMTDALSFRAQFNEAVGEAHKASINDLIVRASALALQRHPEFNATIGGDQITQHGAQHVCIGIALDDGLIAPAILDAGAKTLAEIAVAARDLVDRAKNGRLKPDEMAAGTFTISNLGAFGIETLVAIIQPPQTAILGIGAVAPQAVVRDGAVVVRQMMKVALSADHRVTDGAQGAQFLGEIKRLLERPLLLVL